MGERQWGEGVLIMGGKAAGRREARHSGGVEQEAAAFGQALSRIAGISEDLVMGLMPVIQRNVIDSCFPKDEANAKQATLLLPRSLAILSAVREPNIDPAIVQQLDDITTRLAEHCLSKLLEAFSTKSSAAALYAETLVDILRSHATLVDDISKQVSHMGHRL